MEEDIELIEEFSREFRNASRFKLDFPITMYIHDDTHNAITNLLKDYKKVKQDNFEIKQTYRRIARHLIDIKQIELAEYMLAQIKDVPVWTVGDGRDYIPKSEIRDKIQELNKQEKEQLKGMKGQDRYSVKQEFMFRRNILTEILGEE